MLPGETLPGETLPGDALQGDALQGAAPADSAAEFGSETAAFAGRPTAIGSIDHEALFSVGKMAELLQSGSDSQRAVILFEVQQLLDHCLADTLRLLIPVLCRYCHQWVPDLQISAAEALLDVVHKKVPSDVAKMISAAAFRVVKVATMETIYEAWGEILVAVLPNVHWTEEELARVIALVDAHANRNSEVSRKLAARVLGSLSVCLTSYEVEKFVLLRALHLCQDQDVDVRGMVTESMAFIGAALPLQITEQKIWARIVVLLQDENARIHAATLRTIAHILDAHRTEGDQPSTLFAEQLPPVFNRHNIFCRKAAAEDQRLVDDDSYLLLEIFSEVFGQLTYSVYPFLLDEMSRRDTYKAFLGMATCNGPVVRRHCAFNMPGVAARLRDKYQLEMSNIVEFLARDPDPETRWNLAAGIHETTRLLIGKSSSENLFKALVSLLQDENPLVRMNTLQHFASLLESLVNDGEAGSFKRLAPVFSNISLLSEGNWRTQELLANQLRDSMHLIPSESIRRHVLPLLYEIAEESTYLVRKAAMASISRAIRYVPHPDDRAEVMNLFKVEWGQGTIYWQRTAFIHGGHCAVLHDFSRGRFREFFAVAMLRMAHDPVPNVRLKLALILADLARACESLPEFSAAVRQLQGDDDADVREAMDRAMDQIAHRLAASGGGEAMMIEAREADSVDAERARQEDEEVLRAVLNRKTRAATAVVTSMRQLRTAFSKENEKAGGGGGGGYGESGSGATEASGSASGSAASGSASTEDSASLAADAMHRIADKDGSGSHGAEGSGVPGAASGGSKGLGAAGKGDLKKQLGKLFKKREGR